MTPISCRNRSSWLTTTNAPPVGVQRAGQLVDAGLAEVVGGLVGQLSIRGSLRAGFTRTDTISYFLNR